MYTCQDNDIGKHLHHTNFPSTDTFFDGALLVAEQHVQHVPDLGHFERAPPLVLHVGDYEGARDDAPHHQEPVPSPSKWDNGLAEAVLRRTKPYPAAGQNSDQMRSIGTEEAIDPRFGDFDWNQDDATSVHGLLCHKSTPVAGTHGALAPTTLSSHAPTRPNCRAGPFTAAKRTLGCNINDTIPDGSSSIPSRLEKDLFAPPFSQTLHHNTLDLWVDLSVNQIPACVAGDFSERQLNTAFSEHCEYDAHLFTWKTNMQVAKNHGTVSHDTGVEYLVCQPASVIADCNGGSLPAATQARLSAACLAKTTVTQDTSGGIYMATPFDESSAGIPTSEPSLRCPHQPCSSRLVFRRQCDLNKHYRQHNRRYFCRVVGCKNWDEGNQTVSLGMPAGFPTIKDRDRHEKGHNPSLPCPDCGRLFGRFDNLRAHWRRRHGHLSQAP